MFSIHNILPVHVAEYDDSDPTVPDAQRALRKMVSVLGTTTEYEGDVGAERMTKRTAPNGLTTTVFEGDKGQERKVEVRRFRTPTDTRPYEEVLYFGARNSEYMYQKEEYPTPADVYHKTTYYVGAMHHERMASMEVYEVRGVERRLVRTEYANGNKVYFDGEPGKERKYMVVTGRGHVLHFTGEYRREQLVKTEHPDGTVEWAPTLDEILSRASSQ